MSDKRWVGRSSLLGADPADSISAATRFLATGCLNALTLHSFTRRSRRNRLDALAFALADDAVRIQGERFSLLTPSKMSTDPLE